MTSVKIISRKAQHQNIKKYIMSAAPEIICVPYQGLSYGYCVKLTPEELKLEQEKAATKAAASCCVARKDSGKRKRNRTCFNIKQLTALEREYSTGRYIDRDRRKELAKQLNLTERIIRVWFTNRRMKSRNHPEVLGNKKYAEVKFDELGEFLVFGDNTSSQRSTDSATSSELNLDELPDVEIDDKSLRGVQLIDRLTPNEVEYLCQIT